MSALEQLFSNEPDLTNGDATPQSEAGLEGNHASDAELVEALTDFAGELAAISDLSHLSALLAERAISLVGADAGVVFLETRPLSTQDETLHLVVPLRMKDEELGVLIVERHPSTAKGDTEACAPPFTHEEKQRLKLLANIAAIAVANIRRAHMVHRRASWRDRALDVLQEIGRVMGSTLELVPLMRRIISAAAHALHAEAGMLALLDGSNSLTLRAVTGAIPRDLIGTQLETEQSLIGWVIRHGRAELVTDPSTDPRVSSGHPAIPVGFVPRALLAAPLVTKGRVIGAVEIANKRDDVFNQEDLHLLEALAVPAAAAIENARLYERLLGQAMQHETVVRVSKALSSAVDVETILQEVVESALLAIPAAFTAVVHLLDTATGKLRPHCHAGRPAWEIKKQKITMNQGIVEHAFATRQFVNVGDVLNDPRYTPGPGRVVCHSMMVATLIVEGKPLGTLGVNGLDRDTFSAEDEQMLRSLAAQAAVVLRNAQLFAQAEQRAAELEIANRHLQDLARRKTQFVQNTSHELRTPLTFLRGYLEMFQNDELGPLSEEQKSAIDILNRKCQQLVDLVNDITSLIDIELRAKDIQSLNLVDLVARSVSAQDRRCQQAGIAVETQWPDDPVIVKGDQYRLTQVFNHLLDNAIKFSPDGGRIQVRIWIEQDDAHVQVADQGIGILPEEQDLIFDLFYQVDGSTTRRFEGTGLGLAIVKETVEAHRGTVQVDSSGIEGEGSTFTVVLPLTKENDAQNEI